MDIALAPLSDAIKNHSDWAGPILGLITFGESLVVVGAFFPATALMVLAGSLAALGLLDPVQLLFWCIAGAVGGDAVSFWLGRAMGPTGTRHRVLKAHRRSVARARLFIRRYGVLSIVICRFLGPVRALVPTIAGMMSMGHQRFQVANVISALVWVPLMVAPGYLATRGYGLLQFSAAIWVVIGLAGCAVLFLAVRAWRIQSNRGAAHFLQKRTTARRHGGRP